jgi:hypothetical protein
MYAGVGTDGKNTLVGTVEIVPSADGTQLVITWTIPADSEWYLIDVHAAAAVSCEDFHNKHPPLNLPWMNKQHNPQLGNWYKDEGTWLKENSLTIPMPTGVDCDDSFVVAVHAKIGRTVCVIDPTTGSEVCTVQAFTAWPKGVDFGGNSWATYLGGTALTCGCMPIRSDTTTEWSATGADGSWSPTAATWVHNAWPKGDPTKSNYKTALYGGIWIWRPGSQTDPATGLTLTDVVYEYDNVPNFPDGGWYFRKVFTIPGDVITSPTVMLSGDADNSEACYVNGNKIYQDGSLNRDGSNGAGSDIQEWSRINTTNIAPYLTPGENTILFRALNYFKAGTTGKPPSYDNPYQNPAGLIFSTGTGDGVCYKGLDIPEYT